MLWLNKNTMTSDVGRARVDCPLCGVNVSLSHLQYLHICGRHSGRPKRTLEASKDKAEKALLLRMARLSLDARQVQAPTPAPVQAAQSVHEDSPIYTEYNGLSIQKKQAPWPDVRLLLR